jgi:hypothetical protein
LTTLHASALRRAAEIWGEEGLAKRLGVTLPVLRLWMAGRAELPGDAFLKVADLLGEHALQQLRQRPD